jgi:hypothetical protein
MKLAYILTIVSFVFLGCTKENSNNTKLEIGLLYQDKDFIELISESKLIIDSSFKYASGNLLSETEFINHFKKAVNENDLNSRKIISSSLGFVNDSVFWNKRKFIREKINLLSNKYDLTNLNQYMISDAVKQQLISKKINLNNSLINKSNALEGVNCLQQFTNCRENVTATYAFDQFQCVLTGSLGWTGIGLLLFTACEATAYYKSYVGDRTCLINYNLCLK